MHGHETRDPAGASSSDSHTMSEQHEQQLGEEERLLEAIVVQRELIDAVAVDDADERAPQQRKLGQLEFKYQLLVERKRLTVARAQLKQHSSAKFRWFALKCMEEGHKKDCIYYSHF